MTAGTNEDTGFAELGLRDELLKALTTLGYEEPTLRRTYGAEYEAFVAAVPRWIPRSTPFRRPP